jgi:hypothetical protein
MYDWFEDNRSDSDSWFIKKKCLFLTKIYNMSDNSNSGGLSLATILFLIFLVLKLTNYIDWSWWWVTSPLWISAILVILIVSIFLKSKR